KKFILFLFCFMFILIPLEIEASEDEPSETHKTEEDLRTDMIDNLSIEELDQHWQQLYHDYGDFLTEVPKKSIKEMIQEDTSISITSMLHAGGYYFFYEESLQTTLVGTLIMLTLFSIILRAISSAFEQN